MKSILNNIKTYLVAIIVVLAVIAGAWFYVGSLMENLDKIKPDKGSAFSLNSPITYDQPLLMKLSDFAISILPLGAQTAKAQTTGNVVKYIDAYQNTDVVQTKSFNKLKEDIILKQPGHPKIFEYQIDMAQFDVSRDSPGNLYFFQKGHKDDNDYKRFTIPAPFMVDADGKKSSTTDVLSALNGAGRLVLKPSAEWLAKAKYPVILDPTIEISVINVHSHPQQGDNWVVDFTTQGTADLKIIPNDQATIDDDEFVSLSCNGEKRQPQILAGDVIYYPNWNCSGTATVIHYTKTAGKHTLKFEFLPSGALAKEGGGQVAYAYNSSCTFCATGGTVTYDGAYTIHTFTSSGTFTVTGSGNVEYLVVAGGGAGTGINSTGSNGTGGGGAGGVRAASGFTITAQAYAITVGEGGISSATERGASGGDSIFSSITSIGGGGGGFGLNDAIKNGVAGGSGGGGASYLAGGSGGDGTGGQGNNGGNGSASSPQYGGGGGGGAGATGSNGTANIGGNGGNGVASSISGASVTYGGGGGGGVYQTSGTPGTGGTGGGGAGVWDAVGIAGSPNTGGGGGGTGAAGGTAPRLGGAGGSGIVIVRYIPAYFPIIFRAGGTSTFSATGGTVSYSGGYKIHTFTSSGTFTVTGSGNVEYLVVAGGGGGGGAQLYWVGGAGGGGGGMKTGTLAVTAGAKTVTVGAGGDAGPQHLPGGSGGNSVFDSITSTGGGGGGTYGHSGLTGGSGGGGNEGTGVGSGTGSEGNAGATYYSISAGEQGGGGGGKGAAASSYNGGVGEASSISGVSTYYAGGGGGSGTEAAGTGGNGGGANGVHTANNGNPGTANTGGGGSGGMSSIVDYGAKAGGAGGSGIVIVRYLIPSNPIIFRTAATDQYTKLLLHADGTTTSFVDSESIPKTITAVADATQSATQSKFGGKSAYFDGTGDYLSLADSNDWNFGTGNFTIDFWMNSTSAQDYMNILSQSVGEAWIDVGINVRVNSADKISFSYGGASSHADFLISTTDVVDGTWHHVAVVRSGNTATLYIDGVSEATDDFSSDSTIVDKAAVLKIGQWEVGIGRDYGGYLDEFRISKGIARWTSNFTPPTSAYSSTGSPIIFK